MKIYFPPLERYLLPGKNERLYVCVLVLMCMLSTITTTPPTTPPTTTCWTLHRLPRSRFFPMNGGQTFQDGHDGDRGDVQSAQFNHSVAHFRGEKFHAGERGERAQAFVDCLIRFRCRSAKAEV